MAGYAYIVDVDAPSEFDPGFEIEVTVQIRNDGDSGDMFSRVVNRDTGETMAELGFYMAAGQTRSLDHTHIVISQTTDFRGRVEAGHGLKDEPLIIDDTEDFTIPSSVAPPPPPECAPDGREEILEYCPNGVDVRRIRRCENGEWVYYTYTCPIEPECTEGAREILEYCWDGSVKRDRVCEDGRWRERTYPCPQEPEEPPEEPPEGETLIALILRRISEIFGLE